MTQDEQLKLLRAIRDLALLPYPWTQDAPDLICYSLGQICGIASRAITTIEGAGASDEEDHDG